MEDNVLFDIGDTIKIVRGEIYKCGFYISHDINRPELFNKDSEKSRVLGYKIIEALNSSGTHKIVYIGDYPENKKGILRAFHTRIVLIEKIIFTKKFSCHYNNPSRNFVGTGFYTIPLSHK